jgi:hypothetical protein
LAYVKESSRLLEAEAEIEPLMLEREGISIAGARTNHLWRTVWRFRLFQPSAAGEIVPQVLDIA